MNTDYLWNINKLQVVNDCMQYDFPGTQKWKKDNPIWDCNVYNKVSPKQAWNNYDLVLKAVENLFYITNKSIIENKYQSFVNKIYKSFDLAYNYNDFSKLNEEVLNRFTIVKIAPKVTAINKNIIIHILKEINNKIDFSNGIYCPMAGFGGIIQGCKDYFNNKIDIEAYDINQNFCNYYGWKQRNVLDKLIITNKIVIACPPFGNKTEHWLGTPDNMYYSFEEWCKLIKNYIKAPNYILIGPEINNQNNNKNKLFKKKYGVMWYKNYTNL